MTELIVIVCCMAGLVLMWMSFYKDWLFPVTAPAGMMLLLFGLMELMSMMLSWIQGK